MAGWDNRRLGFLPLLACAGAAIAVAAGRMEPARTAGLAPGLAYLRDVDPTIVQDLKYATLDNFTGRVVPGYEDSACILARPVAEALARVQKALQRDGLGLKVYDCFRPRRAVQAFVAWAASAETSLDHRRFHPRTAKTALFPEGYIARTSSHSQGVAVDLTLVALPAAAQPAFDPAAAYGPCNGAAEQRAPDNSVDMGTGFDCFDPMSHTQSREVPLASRRWRSRLVEAMAAQGFANYAREWWHFTLPVTGAHPAPDVPAATSRPGPPKQ
jgi:D-alanyl-D-alanine dipeptidase